MIDCHVCDGTAECMHCVHLEPGPCPECHGVRRCHACAEPRPGRVMSPAVGVARAVSPLDEGAERLATVRYLLTGEER